MAYEFEFYRAFTYTKDGDRKVWRSAPMRTRPQAAVVCFEKFRKLRECWTVKVIAQFSDASGKVLDTDCHIERHARSAGHFTIPMRNMADFDKL